MATRREALALQKWLDVHWKQVTYHPEAGTAPGASATRPVTREAELDEYSRHFDMGCVPAGRPTAAYLGRGATPANLGGNALPAGQFWEPTEVPVGDRVLQSSASRKSFGRKSVAGDVSAQRSSGRSFRAPSGIVSAGAGPETAAMSRAPSNFVRMAELRQSSGGFTSDRLARSSIASVAGREPRKSRLSSGDQAEGYNPTKPLPPVPPTANFHVRLPCTVLCPATAGFRVAFEALPHRKLVKQEIFWSLGPDLT